MKLGTFRIAVCAVAFSFFSIAVVTLEGCKKDDSPAPTAPSGTQYPKVASDWKGTATQRGGQRFNLTAKFSQFVSNLSGYWIWTSPQGSDQGQVRVYFNGWIETSGQLSLKDTSYVVEGGGVTLWQLESYTGTMSAGGDTISGAWSTHATGSFALVKQ